jgi:DNA-binding transcriptional LysR family regulator
MDEAGALVRVGDAGLALDAAARGLGRATVPELLAAHDIAAGKVALVGEPRPSRLEERRGATARAPWCCLPWTDLGVLHPRGTHYPGPSRVPDGSTGGLRQANQASLRLGKRHLRLHGA